MYLLGFPLLLVPFAIYNIVAFILHLPPDIWTAQAAAVPTPRKLSQLIGRSATGRLGPVEQYLDRSDLAGFYRPPAILPRRFAISVRCRTRPAGSRRGCR